MLWLYEFAVDAAVASGGLRVRAAAGLDIDSTVELEIEAAPAEPRAIGVRIPAWANDAALAVNGNPAAATREDGYALLERVWVAGDRLRVYYELRAESLREPQPPRPPRAVAGTLGHGRFRGRGAGLFR